VQRREYLCELTYRSSHRPGWQGSLRCAKLHSLSSEACGDHQLPVAPYLAGVTTGAIDGYDDRPE